MPQNPDSSVTVTIYDQQYHLRGVDPAHITALAATVDTKMRAVAQRSATVDSLRVAVLAALNLADELAMVRSQAADAGVVARTSDLHGLLDEVLAG